MHTGEPPFMTTLLFSITIIYILHFLDIPVYNIPKLLRQLNSITLDTKFKFKAFFYLKNQPFAADP